MTLPDTLQLDAVLIPETTFRVTLRATGRLMILKRIRSNPQALQRRLLKLQSLALPQVCLETTLLEFGGAAWSLRPFVPGRSFQDLRVASGGKPVANWPALLLRLSRLLDAIHARGVHIGNLHSRNIFLNADQRIELVDVLDSAARYPGRTVSEGGIELSTSPEQVRGSSAGRRSDVYGVGLVGVELASGMHPCAGSDWTAVLASVLAGESQRAAATLPIALAVRTWLEGATHPSWVMRPGRMGGLIDALVPLVPAALQVEPEAAAATEMLAPLGKGERVHQTLITARTVLTDVALVVPRELKPRPRVALTGAAVAIVAVLLAVFVYFPRRADRALTAEVEDLLLRGRSRKAQELLEAEKTKRGPRPIIDKLQGDVACNRKEQAQCLKHYRAALDGSGAFAADVTVRKNVLAMLDRQDTSFLIAEVAARLADVETALQEGTRSKNYWRRWNSVRALEKKGASEQIDYAEVFAGDLLHSTHCPTRRAAVTKLVQLKDKRALEPLKKAKSQADQRIFGDGCLGDSLDYAIRTLGTDA